jgi:omega-hydroxy-beta-dihydromenaquinone-9 sulfotransferase
MNEPVNHSQPPILIVGYIHTGTTLMINILGKSPALFMLKGESHFIQNLKRLRREFPDLGDGDILAGYVDYLVKLANLGYKRATFQRDQYSLEDIGLAQNDFAKIVSAAAGVAHGPAGDRHVTIFRATMDALAERAGCRRWLEKTPAHIRHLDDIFEFFPDAQVIEMVRDPRATIASRKLRVTDEWREAKEEAGGIIDRNLNFDPVLDSYRWREAIEAGNKAAQKWPGRLIRVRYEDLVGNPEATLIKVCDFLHLNYSPEMLDVGWVNAATRSKQDQDTKISSAVVDKWLTILTAEEIYLSQKILNQNMVQLDYNPVNVQMGVGGKLKSYLSLGQSAARAATRVANRFSG